MSGPWVGKPLPLKEDVRFVAGRGRFIDDLGRPGMLHAAILRSPHAHARIVSMDTERAATLEGVAAVLTGADATRLSGPIRPDHPHDRRRVRLLPGGEPPSWTT